LSRTAGKSQNMATSGQHETQHWGDLLINIVPLLDAPINQGLAPQKNAVHASFTQWLLKLERHSQAHGNFAAKPPATSMMHQAARLRNGINVTANVYQMTPNLLGHEMMSSTIWHHTNQGICARVANPMPAQITALR
jgi:hypothetical protein